jgi:hypothetical protein
VAGDDGTRIASPGDGALRASGLLLAWADAGGHQAAFASWSSGVAAKELALFFEDLHGKDRILPGPRPEQEQAPSS